MPLRQSACATPACLGQRSPTSWVRVLVRSMLLAASCEQGRTEHAGLSNSNTHVSGNACQGLIPRRQKNSLNGCPASLGVKSGSISLLIANSRSTFDSAAHFYGGETTNLTLRAAIPADSLVYLGPDLVLARFTFKEIFSECLILSTMDTSKHD